MLSHTQLAAIFAAILLLAFHQSVGIFLGLRANEFPRESYGHLIEPTWMPGGQRYAPYVGYDVVRAGLSESRLGSGLNSGWWEEDVTAMNVCPPPGGGGGVADNHNVASQV